MSILRVFPGLVRCEAGGMNCAPDQIANAITRHILSVLEDDDDRASGGIDGSAATPPPAFSAYSNLQADADLRDVGLSPHQRRRALFRHAAGRLVADRGGSRSQRLCQL